MSATGEPISAEDAYEYGLVNRVVADHELFDTAISWARKLAQQPPLAVEQIKQVSGNAVLDEGLRAEGEAFATVFASQDAKEGIGLPPRGNSNDRHPTSREGPSTKFSKISHPFLEIAPPESQSCRLL